MPSGLPPQQQQQRTLRPSRNAHLGGWFFIYFKKTLDIFYFIMYNLIIQSKTEGSMKYNLIRELNENGKVISYVEDNTGRRVSPIYRRQSEAKKFYNKLQNPRLKK